MIGFIAGIFVGGMVVFLVMGVLFIAKEDRPVKAPWKRETFRDRLTKEKPWCVKPIYDGGCLGCPRDHGYESVGEGMKACEDMKQDCTACWNREVKR